MLQYLITSRAKRSVLRLILMNQEKPFYVREVARLTGEPLNAVRRELANLEKAGLVTPRSEGTLKYYSVNKEFPFYPELKKIIYATVGIGEYLTTRLEKPEQIELAFIYGSVARGEEKADSDIDLFIVGDADEEVLHHLISEIERDTGRTINYTLMTRKEFDARIIKSEPFIKRILAEPKMIIKGSLNVN
jgi:predicted nucleotidyltransferase